MWGGWGGVGRGPKQPPPPLPGHEAMAWSRHPSERWAVQVGSWWLAAGGWRSAAAKGHEAKHVLSFFAWVESTGALTVCLTTVAWGVHRVLCQRCAKSILLFYFFDFCYYIHISLYSSHFIFFT